MWSVSVDIPCKYITVKEIVVLTTEGLPWLQTWEDSGCERFALGSKTNLHKATQEATAQLILQPQHTDNSQKICERITLQKTKWLF